MVTKKLIDRLDDLERLFVERKISASEKAVLSFMAIYENNKEEYGDECSYDSMYSKLTK